MSVAPQADPSEPRSTRWSRVRGEFALDPSWSHFAAFLLAAHPRPVAQAIERHRRGFDANPAAYFEGHVNDCEERLERAAAEYSGSARDGVAVTTSTTAALGLAIAGLQLRSSDEVVTTEHDHFALHETVRLKALQCGSAVRRVALYERSETVNERLLVDRVLGAIGPCTRVLALTWVHSDTGVKLPIAAVARRLRDLEARRDPSHRVLLVVDGVHGFGVEDVAAGDLGCDFFAAGCHKWLFGPRGTALLLASEAGLAAHAPVLASNGDLETKRAWRAGRPPAGPPAGRRIGAGGMSTWEHRWALADALEWHASLGRADVARRTRALASRLKCALVRMPHVVLHTPLAPSVSSGLVCFGLPGRDPASVVAALAQRRIVASESPYRLRAVRVATSILNDEDEVDALAAAVDDLA